MSITTQTRRSSYDQIMPAKLVRKEYIKKVLSSNESGMTAEEITVELHRRGIIPRLDFNYARPRLTEMRHDGEVRVIGKRESPLTGRATAVWSL